MRVGISQNIKYNGSREKLAVSAFAAKYGQYSLHGNNRYLARNPD